MKDRYLIIGSNSFSGSNFINYILSKKVKVIGTSRSNEINKIYLSYKKNKLVKNFSFFKVDLNHDYLKLFKIIKKFKPNFNNYSGIIVKKPMPNSVFNRFPPN